MLAKISPMVFTIEPAVQLYHESKQRLARFANVEVLHGQSEKLFPELLLSLRDCESVSFFLDGHYSGGPTFRGEIEAPIMEELKQISLLAPYLDKVAVIIDDVRLCGPRATADPAYPKLNQLVDWANENNLEWFIEHDMFIAKTPE